MSLLLRCWTRWIGGPDPLPHRLWVALHHSRAFVLLMGAAVLCWLAAGVVVVTGIAWISVPAVLVGMVVAWYGWRSGAVL